jgi:hypothetical protein
MILAHLQRRAGCLVVDGARHSSTRDGHNLEAIATTACFVGRVHAALG